MEIETTRGLKSDQRGFFTLRKEIWKSLRFGVSVVKTELPAESPRAHAKLRTKGPIKI